MPPKIASEIFFTEMNFLEESNNKDIEMNFTVEYLLKTNEFRETVRVALSCCILIIIWYLYIDF